MVFVTAIEDFMTDWLISCLKVMMDCQSIKFIYKALLTADVTKCCTETQPKTPNSKKCRCRSTGARKNSLERPEPRKKPREEPGYNGWPVLFWLCRVEIITEHDQDVQMFIDDQQGQIITMYVHKQCNILYLCNKKESFKSIPSWRFSYFVALQ